MQPMASDRDADLNLVLASRSPRRAQMLRDAGYIFEQADPPFADPPQPQAIADVTAAELAADLALRKAQSLAPEIEPGSVILAADTICVGEDGQLLGQPATAAQARAMIEHFADAAHQVVTGVAILPVAGDQPIVFADAATVTLGKLTSEMLDTYLASAHWQGKAGGYNLADRQNAGWPIRVDGDPTTVMGLPMRRLPALLAKVGITARQAEARPR